MVRMALKEPQQITGIISVLGMWAAGIGASRPCIITLVVIQVSELVGSGKYKNKSETLTRDTYKWWFDDNANPIRLKVRSG